MTTKPFRKLTPAQTERIFPSRWRKVNRGRWVNQVNELRAEVELQTGIAEARQNDIDGLMAESQSSREAMRRARFKIDELRAENERLRAECQGWADTFAQNMKVIGDENERMLVDNAELSAECDQYQAKLTETWAEVAELRAALARYKE